MYKGRVIFGRLKHRIIDLPSINTTKSTTDALKESLFNCLIHRFQIDFSEWTVIDLFAGSGALGIESASLGSNQVLFFENNRTAYNIIQSNITNLNLKNISYVLRTKVENINLNIIKKYINNNKILVFMDPPYKEINLLKRQINRFIEAFKYNELLIVVETNNPQELKIYNPIHQLNNSKERTAVFVS